MDEADEWDNVEFRVLGPLEVRDADGGAVGLGGPRPRAVLARLLVAQGAVVPAETLIDDLYGDAAPPSALPTLHSYVSNLRRAIEPDRGPRARPRTLIARPPGYLLAAADVDALRFAELVNRAEFRSAEEALACLEEALGLWRGSPYEEFQDEPWAIVEVSRLRELRLVAVERRARALLDLGRPQALITELEAETVANPLRERLWCLLALSLYRTGRQAEALAVLRTAARRLSEELGLDPGPELRSLESDILRQAGSLAPVDDTPALVAAPGPLDVPHGREAELAELVAVAERAAPAGLAVAEVSGEPGIGKTRLLEAFGEHCARLGRLVLHGRCHDAEGTPALWPWTQVFQALEPHCPPPDREPLSGLLDARPEAPPDAGDPAEALLSRRNQAAARWLVTASRAQPLVIVLDDLQWADPASLDLLRHLVMLLRGGAVTLVAAFRTGTGDVLGRLVRYDLSRVRLTGVGPEAVRAIAADLGVELDDESCARMADRTGGNPFFLRESIRLLAQNPDVDEVPEAVTELVRLRLDALAGVTDVLAVAALAGREFDPAVVARVAGEEAYGPLDRAVRGGLLAARAGGRLAFVHDLVREALVRDLPPLRRAALHRDLAAALSARPATDVEVIAHHAVQAGPVAYGEAVRWARAAAEQAELRLGYAESASWLGHAVAAHDACGGDPAEHVELLLRQVRALLAAGEPAAARRVRDQAVRAADRVTDGGAALRVRALTSFDTPTIWTLRDPYGTADPLLVRRFENALRELPEPDGPERAMLLAGLAQELYDASGDPRAEGLSAQAVAMARRLGDRRLLMRALNARHLSLPRPPHVHELADLAAELHELADGEPAYQLLANMMDTHNRLELFDVTGADLAAARCDDLLDRLPLPWPRFQHTLWRAGRLVLGGHFDQADDLYADAADQASCLGIWHATRAVTAGRLALDYHRGTMAAAGPLIDVLRGANHALDQAARTLHRHAQGRLDEARKLDGQPLLDRSRPSTLCLRAAAAAALGRVHECRLLYEALLPFGGRITVLSACAWVGPVDWHLALLAEATGRHESAVRHLTELERLAARNGLTWWRDRAAEARRGPGRKHLQLATSG
ncbi:BTAD domain-containing putative transcriptional regulator [Nonomuraea sp. NPDC049655]|uniref:BTAD domain-containing putative transcriptional regulator n=1 Tax=Nonomuraea sp. NPDC049655 TaxID=3364355 RepID=UPI00379FEBFA